MSDCSSNTFSLEYRPDLDLLIGRWLLDLPPPALQGTYEAMLAAAQAHGPRERNFTTENVKANFSTTPFERHQLDSDQLVLMTIRSHDQFNTTVYEYNDRYRGIHNERRVIFLNATDMADRGIQSKQLVNITSHFEGQQRHAEKFIAVPYDIPRGNCAVYFPEGNVLVPIGSVARISNTPTSKFVIVTVAPVGSPVGQRIETRDQVAVPA